jgi:serine/threonine-protein kinase
MSCPSSSALIWHLAGHAPEHATHVNSCASCRSRSNTQDIRSAVEAVREVSDARPGTMIADRYRVEDILGAGTFGLVVRATVDGADREHVAIKLLRPRFNQDEETLARFEREARILRTLRSQRICRSQSAGTTKAGTQYIVTELLHGETLRTVLAKRGPLPIPLAAAYLTQVCEALGEAHATGVVHRDLKPDNVFVVEAGGRAEIKLLDFGVARAMHDPRLTSSGQFIGSPLYMSPEQLSAPKTVGPGADIWAIGVILQELVTGTPPFLGPTVAVVCSRILDGMRDPIEGPPAVLEAIIDRCLQHHPQNRYASVTELVIALAPHIDPEDRPPVLAATATDREAKPIEEALASTGTARTKRLWWIVAAIPIVLGIVIWRWVEGGSSETPLQPAVSPDAGVTIEIVSVSPGLPADAAEQVPLPLATSVTDAVQLIKDGNSDLALASLRQLWKADPDSAYIPFLLGNLYFDKTWWSVAIDHYEMALEKNPAYRNNSTLNRNLIKMLASGKTRERAVFCFRSKIGTAALPYLKIAAESDTNTVVRESAAALVKALGR